MAKTLLLFQLTDEDYAYICQECRHDPNYVLGQSTLMDREMLIRVTNAWAKVARNYGPNGVIPSTIQPAHGKDSSWFLAALKTLPEVS